MAYVLELPSDVEGDDCAACCGMSASRLRWPSPKPSTTALDCRPRKWRRGARAGRRWSSRRTPAQTTQPGGSHGRYVTAGAPLLAVVVPALRGDDGVDGTSLRYLLRRSLARKEEEEEEEGRRAALAVRQLEQLLAEDGPLRQRLPEEEASSSSRPGKKKKKKKASSDVLLLTRTTFL